jgi:Na+/melibiose symporter-like transporter
MYNASLQRATEGGNISMAAKANGPTIVTNARQKWAFSAGNFSVNLIFQGFATYIVFYYVDVLGVRPGLISLAMVIHGIFNAVLNPLIGHISDRTSSRWGRRIPYMLFGIAPLAAVFTLLWFPLLSGTEAALFWYFLIIVLLYDILFVIVVLNYSALFPEMFVTIQERAAVSSWRQMFGILGLIVGVALPPLLYSHIGWKAMGFIFGVLSLLFFAVMIRGCVERGQHDAVSFKFMQAVRLTLMNRAFVTYVIGNFFVQFTFALLSASIPFFTKYVLGEADSANTWLLGSIFVTAIPFAYVWGRWTQRLGARRTILAAVTCYAFALAPFAIVSNLTQAIVTAVAIGFGLAGLLVLLDVMLSEVIDQDERKTGVRREGMYFGMNGFIVRWSISLQAVVMGIILETSGYVANAPTQPDSALWGMRFMLSSIPVIALACAFISYSLYPLRRSSR